MICAVVHVKSATRRTMPYSGVYGKGTKHQALGKSDSPNGHQNGVFFQQPGCMRIQSTPCMLHVACMYTYCSRLGTDACMFRHHVACLHNEPTHALNFEFENSVEFLCVLHACPARPQPDRARPQNRAHEKDGILSVLPCLPLPRDPTAPSPVGR